ncbi:MAG: glutamate 5-kinase [Pseudomonadota bacterium]
MKDNVIDKHPAHSLRGYKRVVVKVGSALLVDHESGRLRHEWLDSLADDMAALKAEEAHILVVSSGAIALGRHVLGLAGGALKLEESQAAAATGQIALARAWDEAFRRHALTTGQILLTLSDTEERRRYLNARATIETLLRVGAVPIINENDTVATQEIRYGDNDRLGARVATMAGADCLVLLSDVDGLYSAPPQVDPNARHIADVAEITPEIEAMAGASGTAFASGGMRTKIEAAKIAAEGGTAMLIASGKELNPLKRIEEGAFSTLFAARKNPVTARKKWISGHLEPHGTLTVDHGAVDALKKGRSLLPAGVTSVSGTFERGDTVLVQDPDGREIGRGLVGYDVADARRIVGLRSGDIEAVLGYPPRAALIHRDDLVLREASAQSAGMGLSGK